MMVARVRSDQWAIKVDCRSGTESIQSRCHRRHGRAQDHCDQQSDKPVRHLLENKSNEYVIRFLAFWIHARLLENCLGLVPQLARLRVELANLGHGHFSLDWGTVRRCAGNSANGSAFLREDAIELRLQRR